MYPPLKPGHDVHKDDPSASPGGPYPTPRPAGGADLHVDAPAPPVPVPGKAT